MASEAATPPVPAKPVATCGALVSGRCYNLGSFTLTTSSPGAHHFKVCRSHNTLSFGGCDVVVSNNAGPSITISGSHLPSSGFRRGYRFSACDALNNCTRWSDSQATYVYRDVQGPTAPGPTTAACNPNTAGLSGCWVTGSFTISASPASDSGSGVDPNGYHICRSNNSLGGWAGCDYTITLNGGTSILISGSHLPSDGFRRAYRFRARDRLGTWGPWNTPLYVRVDRHNPTLHANNASTLWFASRTATVFAVDTVGGSPANSGIQEVRFRWNAAHNGSCTTGTPTSHGAVLTVPAGDNWLYLCARDHAGRRGFWNGGPYRVDNVPPTAPGPTTANCNPNTTGLSGCWVSGDFEIKATPASDAGGSGLDPAGYLKCRSNNSSGGFAGCDRTITEVGGPSLLIKDPHLPPDGIRRAYRFLAHDNAGNRGPWNTPLYVRVDRHNPTVSADNASNNWFPSRTARVTAADAIAGAAANSGIQEVRYRWNSPPNPSCTSGTLTSNGAVLTVPDGDNRLHLCARDHVDRVSSWQGGPYRVRSVFVYRGMIQDPQGNNVGARYKEVQVGDFNGDGWPDIYAAQRQPGQVTGPNIDRVLINTKPSSLEDVSQIFRHQEQERSFLDLRTRRCYDVEAADLDGDNALDIVRPEDDAKIDILWGIPRSSQPNSPPGAPGCCMGKDPNCTTSCIGSGMFEPQQIIQAENCDPQRDIADPAEGVCDPNRSVEGTYDDVAVGDLDGDGDLDILVAQYDENGSNLYLENQLANGNPRTFRVRPLDAAKATHTISVGDFDSDGALDVALAKTQGRSVLLRNDKAPCDFSFTRYSALDAINSAEATTTADFVDLDGNGKLDIYQARNVTDGNSLGLDESQHVAYFQDNEGVLRPMPLPRGEGDPDVYDARYANVDLDEAETIEILRVNILSQSQAQSSTLQALRVTGRWPETVIEDVSTEFFGGVWRGEMGIELADLDRDGDLDLILAGSTANGGFVFGEHAAVHIYENRTIDLEPGTNRPPSAADDILILSPGSSSLVPSERLKRNDSDPDADSISVIDYIPLDQTKGRLDLGNAQGVTYTPPPGFTGIDRFAYRIRDNALGNRKSAQGVVTVIVTGCN